MKRIVIGSVLTLTLFLGAAQLPALQEVFNTAALTFGGSPNLTTEQKAIKKSANRWGLDPKMMYAICMMETNCSTKRNTHQSSARGIYQYIKITWVASFTAYIKKLHLVDASESSRLRGVLGNCRIDRVGKRLVGNCNMVLNERYNPYVMADVFAFDRVRRHAVVAGRAQKAGIPVGAVHYMDHFRRDVSKNAGRRDVYNKSFSSVISSKAARANGFTNKTFGQVVIWFTDRYNRFARKTPSALLQNTKLSIDDFASYETEKIEAPYYPPALQESAVYRPAQPHVYYIYEGDYQNVPTHQRSFVTVPTRRELQPDEVTVIVYPRKPQSFYR